MTGTSLISPPGGWGAQKPPSGTPVNRAHPLAKGLRTFLAFNEGAGTSVYDAVRGACYPVLGTTAAWKPSRAGPAFYGSSQSYVQLAASAVGRYDSTEFSIFAEVELPASIPIACVMFACDYVPYVSPYHVRNFWVYSTNSIYLAWNNGSALYSLQSGSGTAILGRRVTLAATWRRGQQRIYQNGVLMASSTVTGAPAGFSNSVNVGNNISSSGVTPFLLYNLGYWDRVLTPAEIAELTCSPYAVFDAQNPCVGETGCRPLVDGHLAATNQSMVA